MKSIEGKGYEPADRWLSELNNSLGEAPNFVPPDLNSYHQMRWGFGSTPYGAEQLTDFARAGTIVDRLNEFMPSDYGEGPSKRSLSDALIDAIGTAPDAFLDQLPQFLEAKPEYQYALIAGFEKLWDAWDGKRSRLPWDRTWPKLVGFFEAILTNEEFWKAAVPDEPVLSPARDWVPSEIAEFLKAGTHSDDKAYAPELLPRTLPLVLILLDKSEPQSEPREGDALNGAINTPRGKAIEALFEHALRRCRLSDKVEQSHADAWRELEPIFDAELGNCRGKNFEFSALAGAYMANLDYMSRDWVQANIKAIFPIEFPANCLAALNGLAFAPAMRRPVFNELIASGVLDWALRQDLRGDYTRESLLHRLGLSYLWGDEQLEGPRFGYLFQNRRLNDLEELSRYFRMVWGEPLTQDQTERILLFWDRCVGWGNTVDPRPANSCRSSAS